MSVLGEAFCSAFDLLSSGDAETFAAVQATLQSSGLAMIGCLGFGVPLGFLLGYCRFPGRGAVRLAVETALCFPTVVLGLLVYLLLARQGPLADLELLFTVPLSMQEQIMRLGLVDVIGHITPASTGCYLVTPDGQDIKLKAQGFPEE